MMKAVVTGNLNITKVLSASDIYIFIVNWQYMYIVLTSF